MYVTNKQEDKKMKLSKEQFEKVVIEYCKASGCKDDELPEEIEIEQEWEIDENQTLIKFVFDLETTYAIETVSFGYNHNPIVDDVIFLNDWQSGEEVTVEDIAEHNWGNRSSEVIGNFRDIVRD